MTRPEIEARIDLLSGKRGKGKRYVAQGKKK